DEAPHELRRQHAYLIEIAVPVSALVKKIRSASSGRSSQLIEACYPLLVKLLAQLRGNNELSLNRNGMKVSMIDTASTLPLADAAVLEPDRLYIGGSQGSAYFIASRVKFG